MTGLITGLAPTYWNIFHIDSFDCIVGNLNKTDFTLIQYKNLVNYIYGIMRYWGEP